MSALSELYPVVRQRCPGVIDFMMLDALIDAYRDFCKNSEFLLKKIKLAHVDKGNTATLDAGIGFSILKIESVKHNGNDLFVDNDYEIDSAGEISFFEDMDQVIVEAVILPKRTFDENLADPYLIENFGEAIADGAASRLRLQPGEKWFNAELAMDLRTSFVEGYRDAYRLRQERFKTFENKTRKHQFY